MYETESNAGLLEKYLRTAKKAEKLRNREDDGPSAVLEQLEADELALEDAVLDRMLDASERKAIAENLGGIIGLFEKLASA